MKYNIMNTVKRYYAKGICSVAMLCSLVGGGLLTSCDLEVEPRNIITFDKFWNEKVDVENILAGCYSTMQGYEILSRMMIWGEFRSDNLTMNGYHIEKDIDLEYLLKENITASNRYTLWGEFYAVINRCNTVIKYAPMVADKDPSYTQSEVKAHVAEATAIRSLLYFYLIRTFKDVPYTTEAYIDESQDATVPALPFEAVLDSCITSLEGVKKDAVKRYPITNPQYQTARMTQCAINAMLCDMYLWKKDYQKCIDYAQLVIDEKKDYIKSVSSQSEKVDYSKYYDYPLTPTYISSNKFGKSFNEIFVNGFSNESILELAFSGDINSMPCNRPVSLFYGNAATGGYVIPSDYVAKDKDASDRKVFVNKMDGRAYESFRFNASGSPTGINKFTCRTPISLYVEGSWTNPNEKVADFYKEKSSWGSMYNAENKDNDWISQNKANWVIYRLTDIMLLQAEAYSQLMSDAFPLTEQDEVYRDKAFELMNAVCRRAIYKETLAASDGLSKAGLTSKIAVENMVMDERQRELLFEGKRYYDLVRKAQRDGNTQYIRKRASKKDANLASVIEGKLSRLDAIYMPYHIDEIKANKYLKQNPAFGSGENSSFENTASN